MILAINLKIYTCTFIYLADVFIQNCLQMRDIKNKLSYIKTVTLCRMCGIYGSLIFYFVNAIKNSDASGEKGATLKYSD